MHDPNPYLLLTPGPLSTPVSVRQAMLQDWCTWDDDYNVDIVQTIREKLVALATRASGYTSVLMQGSGTASVEATLGTVIGPNDKLLVLANGAYGARMAQITERLKLPAKVFTLAETMPPDPNDVGALLTRDPSITHVAMVHCETTTGMLNPLESIVSVAKSHGKTVIIDAMSSFGGIPLDMDTLGIDFLISSANKCIEGVPGFGFVIARTDALAACDNQARSLSLDLYDQWRCMEANHGKWRYTSPTHVVRAFYQALLELESEGGVTKRHQRYHRNQRQLVEGMRQLGFTTLLPDKWHSPIITSFRAPDDPNYAFKPFYERLKSQGFVIYPGKVSHADCFRIGNIGQVFSEDVSRLLSAIECSRYWLSEVASRHHTV